MIKRVQFVLRVALFRAVLDDDVKQEKLVNCVDQKRIKNLTKNPREKLSRKYKKRTLRKFKGA